MVTQVMDVCKVNDVRELLNLTQEELIELIRKLREENVQIKAEFYRMIQCPGDYKGGA